MTGVLRPDAELLHWRPFEFDPGLQNVCALAEGKIDEHRPELGM